jgi:hypothetical protein
MLVATGISIIWWNRAMQFRERGVLYGIRFLRWDHVTDCRWSRWTSSLFLEGVDQRHRDVRFSMIVTPENLERVGTVLGEKLLLRQSQLIQRWSGAAARFRLATRRESVARGCLIFLITFALGLLYATRFHQYQAREFEYASIGGALAATVGRHIAARQAAKAGAPRFRLAVWFDWQVLLAWLAFAGLCLCIGSVVSPLSTWLTAGVGLCAGLALYSSLGVFARDKLDLCEHGLVAPHWAYWPWQEISVRQLGTDGIRASFRRGWTRIVATVPPEQRAAVDALLKEKLRQ